jgi:hypothetical protein
MGHVRKVLIVISLASTTEREYQNCLKVNETAVNPWEHPFKSYCNVTFVSATFLSYLGNPRQQAPPAHPLSEGDGP